MSYVTAAQQAIPILRLTTRTTAENIMGRTLHQRVPLKRRSAIADLGMVAGASALLLATVLAYVLL